MNERWGEIFVGTALALRGSSLLFAKIALRTMNPYLLIATRNLIAFFIIAFIFRRSFSTLNIKTVWHSALLGFSLFMSMAFELNGLKSTPSSVTAFIECLVILIVPVITCIMGRRLPERSTVISAIVAMVGVGLLTLKGDRVGFTAGELLVLGGAVWYSISVIITDTAAKNDDPKHVAIFQLLFMSLFAFIGAILFEEVRLPANSTEWAAILTLAVVCSSLGFTLQPLGQKYTTPERAGILTLTNPLTAAALGIVFLHEKMTLSMILGAVIIVFAILYPYLIRVRSSRAS